MTRTLLIILYSYNKSPYSTSTPLRISKLCPNCSELHFTLPSHYLTSLYLRFTSQYRTSPKQLFTSRAYTSPKQLLKQLCLTYTRHYLTIPYRNVTSHWTIHLSLALLNFTAAHPNQSTPHFILP